MTLVSTLALIGAMLILALLPGPGVLAVTAKSMKEGRRQGTIMVAGVLLADYLFIALSMAGLFALAEIMGSFFVILKLIPKLPQDTVSELSQRFQYKAHV